MNFDGTHNARSRNMVQFVSPNFWFDYLDRMFNDPAQYIVSKDRYPTSPNDGNKIDVLITKPDGTIVLMLFILQNPSEDNFQYAEGEAFRRAKATLDHFLLLDCVPIMTVLRTKARMWVHSAFQQRPDAVMPRDTRWGARNYYFDIVDEGYWFIKCFDDIKAAKSLGYDELLPTATVPRG